MVICLKVEMEKHVMNSVVLCITDKINKLLDAGSRRAYIRFVSGWDDYSFNPSVWSDEHCSSCCTLSLIRLYLDKLVSKCNQAASRLFVKELALL